MIMRQLPILFCSAMICASFGAEAQAESAPGGITERYRLEQHGGGLGVEIDESVVVLALGDTDKGPQWVMERQRRDRNWCGSKSADGKCVATDVTSHEWASSSKCAEVSLYAEGFSDFSDTRREQKWHHVAFDVPLVTLQFDPAEGQPPRTLSEYIGPLATWWRAADDGLKNCWTTSAPVIDGHSLEARLS
jgi:hypothetical protein